MPVFTSPPNPREFHQRVWALARQIPAGKVIAYGALGALIPPPSGMSLKDFDAFRARWVGGALAACPPDVPWWRVINAQGKISPRPGAERQRELLEAEGVEFSASGKIDLVKFGWIPPDARPA
ncbi:MAG: O-6-alkylguanine-DNA--cysteine-protein methyltransferase [Anaerolineales bacterium]